MAPEQLDHLFDWLQMPSYVVWGCAGHKREVHAFTWIDHTEQALKGNRDFLQENAGHSSLTVGLNCCSSGQAAWEIAHRPLLPGGLGVSACLEIWLRFVVMNRKMAGNQYLSKLLSGEDLGFDREYLSKSLETPRSSTAIQAYLWWSPAPTGHFLTIAGVQRIPRNAIEHP